jgi:hypothetical protein
MKKLTLFLFLSCFSLTAQEFYDIVILPNNFSLFNGENRYNLDVLTKSFFESEGFKVYSSSVILPDQLANNRCNALFVDVQENNALLVTKVYVELKNCKNEILFTSELGDSREKSFSKAYNEALRKALQSMKGKTRFKKDIVEQTIVVSNPKIVGEFLYAIPTHTGYKLVDEVPNLIFELTKSSSPDIFMAKKGNLQGLLIKKENNWFFEYNDGNQLISERVEVKF